MKVTLVFNEKDLKEMVRERLKKVDVGFEWSDPKIEIKSGYYTTSVEVTLDSEPESLPVATSVAKYKADIQMTNTAEPAVDF